VASRTTFLKLADFTIAVSCHDPRIDCVFRGALQRFASAESKADLSLEVRALERYIPTSEEVLFDSGAVWKLYRQDGGLRLECRSEAFGEDPYKIATFDESFTRGVIEFRAELSSPEMHPLDYPLDEVLMTTLLSRGHGAELHGCGIIDEEGRGHLFVGQSGAGKTTIAGLWGDRAHDIVSDDRVIVREQNGRMMMFGTPWHGEASLSSSASAPLAGIYLLAQSPENSLDLLGPGESVARLFSCAFPPFYDAQGMQWTISFLHRIAQRVPVRALRFAPTPAAVDLVLSSSKVAAA
jgi:hypothetical protein